MTWKGSCDQKHKTIPGHTNQYQIKIPGRTARQPSRPPMNSTAPWHSPATDGVGTESHNQRPWGGNIIHHKTGYTTKSNRSGTEYIRGIHHGFLQQHQSSERVHGCRHSTILPFESLWHHIERRPQATGNYPPRLPECVVQKWSQTLVEYISRDKKRPSTTQRNATRNTANDY